LNNFWTIWKHALGSYSEQDGYDPKLHPIKQITVMAVIQFLMLAVMGVAMLFIGLNV
jgi:hypothetical protein